MDLWMAEAGSGRPVELAGLRMIQIGSRLQPNLVYLGMIEVFRWEKELVSLKMTAVVSKW